MPTLGFLLAVARVSPLSTSAGFPLRSLDFSVSADTVSESFLELAMFEETRGETAKSNREEYCLPALESNLILGRLKIRTDIQGPTRGRDARLKKIIFAVKLCRVAKRGYAMLPIVVELFNPWLF